ncbi:hypothetical protein BKA81DRAFT_29955 [Phyllosticta paracitricarpa]
MGGGQVVEGFWHSRTGTGRSLLVLFSTRVNDTTPSQSTIPRAIPPRPVPLTLVETIAAVLCRILHASIRSARSPTLRAAPACSYLNLIPHGPVRPERFGQCCTGATAKTTLRRASMCFRRLNEAARFDFRSVCAVSRTTPIPAYAETASTDKRVLVAQRGNSAHRMRASRSTKSADGSIRGRHRRPLKNSKALLPSA